MPSHAAEKALKAVYLNHGWTFRYTHDLDELFDGLRRSGLTIPSNVDQAEEIAVTRRGKPVAKITAIGPKEKIDWPDFYGEAIELKGKPVGEIVIEGREDRF